MRINGFGSPDQREICSFFAAPATIDHLQGWLSTIVAHLYYAGPVRGSTKATPVGLRRFSGVIAWYRTYSTDPGAPLLFKGKSVNDLSASNQSWLVRHEFLIRRLHSLSGLIPVGAYMVVHLITNASVLDSPATFQNNVYRIHSLGRILPLVEWGFIFTPILFHAILGVVIIRSGLPNSGTYQSSSNIRYSLQRATGMIAFVFIVWHVFHMHGWFHFEGWLDKVAHPLNGANFRPYNAATSLALAMKGTLVPVLYAIGILSCVFHLANGIWTMGITWGVWITPAAQRRANYVCGAFGVGLAVVGLAALAGTKTIPVGDALKVEEEMYDARVASGELNPERAEAEHKTYSPSELKEVEEEIDAEQEAKSTDSEQADAGSDSDSVRFQ